MDDRLEKALEHGAYRITLGMARKALALKFRNALLYSVNGGIFTVSDTLITFVSTLIQRGHEDAVLIDDKDNPILIEGLAEFLDEITQVYFLAVNDYHAEYEKLRKARTVKTVTGL